MVIVDTIIGALSKAADKIFPDATKALEVKQQIAKVAAELDTAQLQADLQLASGQIDINKIDAASGKWWQAGWRPHVGWACGLAIDVEFIIKPIYIGIKTGTFPVMDTKTLLAILLTMLGAAGMRTFEKFKGVS